MTERTVRPRKNETADLQSAMRDVQLSIASYYDATAGFHSGSEAFETPARATVAFIQKLNDVLRAQIGQRDKYKRIFARQLNSGDPDVELIEAFRYVRNVMSHQLFRTAPDTTSVVGGLGLGFLTSAVWGPIPRRVHNRLHPPTQALKPYYDRHLADQLVLDTFLNAARYFATVCPGCVDRDDRGEWTGFPLRSQPGVSTRLHPAEPGLEYGNPRAQERNMRWLDSRPPGGDFRVICGRETSEGRDVLLGLTFRGSVSYSPFVETAHQMMLDIDAGYPYFHCADADHQRRRALGPYRHGDVIAGVVSAAAFDEWLGDPVTTIAGIVPYSTFMSHEQWAHQIYINNADHLVRRAQRLAAVFPPM